MAHQDLNGRADRGSLPSLPPHASRLHDDIADRPRSGFLANGDRVASLAEHHLGVRAPTPSDSVIGRKIRELRRARIITQKELANMVGVTGAQLHRYETGTTRVAASRLIAIADALGVQADVLIGCLTAQTPQPAQMHLPDGNDIVELIHAFGNITEEKNRAALITVAKMLAATSASAAESRDHE